MKQIISCSRRTDIPAFYYDWLQDCLKAKVVKSKNPLYPEIEYCTDLSPDKIHSIVLWSKDFSKLAADPGYLKDYNLYFQYTITGYNALLEPNVPAYEETLKTLEKMMKTYQGKQFNIRFDPVFLASNVEHIFAGKTPEEGRILMLDRLCRDLINLGMQDARITTSYISLYGVVSKRLLEKGIKVETLSDDQVKSLFANLAAIAHDHGFDLYSCATSLIEGVPHMQKGCCIDGTLLTELFGERATKSKDGGQRKSCGCVKSKDIGDYTQICKHNCVYCYNSKTK